MGFFYTFFFYTGAYPPLSLPYHKQQMVWRRNLPADSTILVLSYNVINKLLTSSFFDEVIKLLKYEDFSVNFENMVCKLHKCFAESRKTMQD